MKPPRTLLILSLRRCVAPRFERMKPLNAAIGQGGIVSHPVSDPTQVYTGLESGNLESGTLDPDKLVEPIASRVRDSLDDAKAEDIVSLDLQGKTSIGDVMLVASGRSNTHVGAIADRVLKALKDAGRPSPRVQGIPHNDWILIDTGDVIVHIFRPEVREFYNLEKLWGEDRPAERRAV